MKRFLAKNRIILSQFFGVTLFLFMIFSHPLLTESAFYPIMLSIGLIMVIIGILGRVFSSIFMSDNRAKNLVKTGIYSITRNPLYLFSFIGALGIAMIYGSLLIIFIVILSFYIYYSNVIKFEEMFLSEKLGSEYIDYLNSGTPRFFPKFALWKSDEYITINYKVVLKTMKESFLFFILALIIILILSLQSVNLIPYKFFVI